MRCAAPSRCRRQVPERPNFRDASAALQVVADALFDLVANAWPPERFARRHGPLQPGIDALADHAALELGKGTRDLEHQPGRWRRRVDSLLIEEQIGPASL